VEARAMSGDGSAGTHALLPNLLVHLQLLNRINELKVTQEKDDHDEP
jgi:hypothetical protein